MHQFVIPEEESSVDPSSNAHQDYQGQLNNLEEIGESNMSEILEDDDNSNSI